MPVMSGVPNFSNDLILERLHGFTQVLSYGKIVPLLYEDFSGGVKGWNLMNEAAGEAEGTIEVDTSTPGLWNGKQCLKMTTNAAANQEVEIDKPIAISPPITKIGATFMASLGTLTNLAWFQFFFEYFYTGTNPRRLINIITYNPATTPRKWTWRKGDGPTTDSSTEQTIWEVDMPYREQSGLNIANKPYLWFPCLLVVDVSNALKTSPTAMEYVCAGVCNKFVDLRGQIGRYYATTGAAMNRVFWFGITQSTGSGSTAVYNAVSDIFIFGII